MVWSVIGVRGVRTTPVSLNRPHFPTAAAQMRRKLVPMKKVASTMFTGVSRSQNQAVAKNISEQRQNI
jgi:hypothetical protein